MIGYYDSICVTQPLRTRRRSFEEFCQSGTNFISSIQVDESLITTPLPPQQFSPMSSSIVDGHEDLDDIPHSESSNRITQHDFRSRQMYSASESQSRDTTPADSLDYPLSVDEGNDNMAAEKRLMEETQPPSARKKTRHSVTCFDHEEAADTFVPERSLRTRTVTQKHPFSTDKLHHNLTKSGKKLVNKSDVENAVMEQIQSSQATAKRSSSSKKEDAKAKSKSQMSKASSRSKSTTPSQYVTPASSSTSITSTNSCLLDDDYKKNNTTLYLWLKGFNEGAAPLPLANCHNLTQLLDFARRRWSTFRQGEVRYITCSIPWNTENNSIMLLDGWDEGFEVMMKEFFSAPVWLAEGSAARLGVKLNVTIE